MNYQWWITLNVINLLKKNETKIKAQFGVRRIGVFGSYVRGEQKIHSDIDILVEFETPTFDNFMDLSFFLENLFGKKVDLVTISGLSPYIGPVIKKEVVWCE